MYNTANASDQENAKTVDKVKITTTSRKLEIRKSSAIFRGSNIRFVILD